MTGEVFVRDTNIEKNGKKLFIVVGIISADSIESLTLFGEHQYAVKNLELINPVDRKELAKGMGTDNLLREPIWRV